MCHSKDRMGSVWDTPACRACPMNFVYKAPSGYSQTWLDIRVADCLQMDTIEGNEGYLFGDARALNREETLKKNEKKTTSRYQNSGNSPSVIIFCRSEKVRNINNK